MVSLADIQARLINDAKQQERNSSGGDGASYPFWNIPDNSTAVVRFLPDGDPNNTFFWVEKQNIKLPFQGVVGGSSEPITITVPCIDMFGGKCPIIAETRPWWKDPKKIDLARRYYKKKTYLFQGFVVSSPLEEKSPPENPIRRFVINKSIYEIIKNSLMNPEMEDLPTDYVGGRDFKLTKTKQGEFANYSTSAWSFKTRSLSEVERTLIEQYGLFTLKDFVGRNPDKDEIDAIKEMFHDSLDGKPFDEQSYGQWYKVYGSSSTTAPKDNDGVEESVPFNNKPTTVSSAPSPAAVAPKPGSTRQSPAEILAKINARVST